MKKLFTRSSKMKPPKIVITYVDDEVENSAKSNLGLYTDKQNRFGTNLNRSKMDLSQEEDEDEEKTVSKKGRNLGKCKDDDHTKKVDIVENSGATKEKRSIENQINAENREKEEETNCTEEYCDCEENESMMDEEEDTNMDEDVVDMEDEFTNQNNGDPSTMVPDGGWGWMVAIGTFLICFIVIPQATCFGILFSPYLLNEGMSSTTIAWIYNVFLFVFNIMMAISGPLVGAFGERKVGFCASAVGVLGVLASAFTPSPYFLFFSFSLLSGMGVGMCYCLCFLVLPQYFYKRRGLANTIMMAGSPVGQMAMSQLINFLLADYGFKGTALIYAGITMNIFVGVALFQPLQWHLKHNEQKLDKAEHKLLAPEDDINTQQLHQSDQSLSQLKEQNSQDCKPSKTTEEESGTLGGSHVSGLSQNSKSSQLLTIAHQSRKNLGGSLLSIASQSFNRSQFLTIEQQTGKALGSSFVNIASSDIFIGASTFNIAASYRSRISIVSKRENTFKRVLNIIIDVFRTTISNLSLLASFRVCIITFSQMFSISSYLNFGMMAPFAMQAAGHSLQDAAWCLFILGVASFLSRCVVSPMADCPKFSVRVCLMCGFLVKAIAVIGFMYFVRSGYPAVWFGLYGVGLGFTMSLQVLMVVTYMGVDLLPPTFGVIGVIAAIGFPIIGPVIGKVRDVTGRYEPSLWMMAALDLLSFLLWLPMPTAVSRDTERDRRKEELEESDP